LPLRLYADECVDGRILAGLHRRGIDVVTAEEEGLLGATDEQQLERATTLGRALLTADRDFFAIATSLIARGESFPGVLFIQPRATVGEAVRSIADAAKTLESAEILDRIEWIP
jgi:predicted nuclease of predicted toxin-antitoxin system